MPLSYNKEAVMAGLLGLIKLLFPFGLASALLSVTLYLSAYSIIVAGGETGWIPPTGEGIYPAVPQVAPYVPEGNITLLGLASEMPASKMVEFLSQFPPFAYLHYVQIAWYALLIPAIFGMLLYYIQLSQGEGIQLSRVVDYLGDIYQPAIVVALVALSGWILTSTVAILALSNMPPDILMKGMMGLARIGLADVVTQLLQAMYSVLKYFPVAVLAAIYIYLFKEVSTGWVGNHW